MASQLLAAYLNQRAGALSCGASMQVVQSAENLLVLVGFDGTTATKMTSRQAGDANALANYLNAYNNDNLAFCAAPPAGIPMY